uniref:Zinc finger CCCH domain-containing protein 15 homolog n=1 Tax=Rhabditophanes sp. KR3021 TaxID=114890 RepID=A0AC35TIJ9_9BILA
MPPKAAAPKASKKVVEKTKVKVIDDKTFGLKNKKGAKMQKFVQQVEHQVKHCGTSKIKLAEMEKAKKKDMEDDLMDIKKLMKPIIANQTDKDVDPKTVLCAFFKQNMCNKGTRCKWSHDLEIEKKVAKKNMFFDSRDLKKEEETNENWDHQKLLDVAEKKHGEKDRKRPNQTDIICKYFLDAVEINKYGWFWECENGESCIYRHALPEGYILKKDKKRLDELNKKEIISLEELIENERKALNLMNAKRVTLATFIEWKKARLLEKKTKEDEIMVQKKKDAKIGKFTSLTGREMFMYGNISAFEDENEEGEDVDYTIQKNEEDEEDENAVAAFEIDDRTFLILDSGEVLDDHLSDEAKKEKIDAPIPEQNENIDIDEDLFQDEDLPDDQEDAKLTKNVEKLKI